jgi:hypothetical protein
MIIIDIGTLLAWQMTAVFVVRIVLDDYYITNIKPFQYLSDDSGFP